MTFHSAPSSFDSALERSARFIVVRWKLLSALAIAVLLILLAYVGYRYREDRIAKEFAEDFYKTIRIGETQTEDQLLGPLSALREKYSSFQGSSWIDAEEILMLINQKDWEKAQTLALSLAQSALNPDLKVAALFAATHSAENRKAHEQALATLDRIIALPHPEYAALARVEKGRLLIVTGKNEEGKQVLQQMLKDTTVSSPLKAWAQEILVWSTIYETQKHETQHTGS